MECDFFMKRFFCCLLVVLIILTSCDESPSQHKSAEMLLHEIMEEFSIEDGYVYSDEMGAAQPLTDVMLERIFFGAMLDDLRYAKSVAVYFSRRFSEQEIVIIQLYDIAHRKTIMALLNKRAEKKENAIVSSQGNYVYLICTDKNSDILSALREKT